MILGGDGNRTKMTMTTIVTIKGDDLFIQRPDRDPSLHALSKPGGGKRLLPALAHPRERIVRDRLDLEDSVPVEA
jgi:hypothetical protein